MELNLESGKLSPKTVTIEIHSNWIVFGSNYLCFYQIYLGKSKLSKLYDAKWTTNHIEQWMDGKKR